MTDHCRVCDAPISAFMSFGQQPIANGFHSPDETGDEYFYELAPAFCESCGTLQIIDQPPAEAMFHDQYAFFTRTSRSMVAHFGDYAAWVAENFVGGPDPFVVEVGSNDGAMLENFAKTGTRHLGIEPSDNTAAEARRHGVETLCAFLNPETAKSVVETHGNADAVIAANVICHIPDVQAIAQAIDILLKDDGVFVFEEPYLGDMVENTSYDQLYDEHVFIFSLRAVSAWFKPFGMELVDALPQGTHGGSMRYVIARNGARAVSPRVAELTARETELGLDKPETFDAFRTACEESRDGLVKLLRQLNAEGKRVVGYGATSKSTTVMNYCGIGPDDIAFISDTTPIKQGKLTPGTNIPVRPYEEFAADYPDYAVLFAWNHKAEIFANEGDYVAAGGKWITFVPRVEVITE